MVETGSHLLIFIVINTKLLATRKNARTQIPGPTACAVICALGETLLRLSSFFCSRLVISRDTRQTALAKPSKCRLRQRKRQKRHRLCVAELFSSSTGFFGGNEPIPVFETL